MYFIKLVNKIKKFFKRRDRRMVVWIIGLIVVSLLIALPFFGKMGSNLSDNVLQLWKVKTLSQNTVCQTPEIVMACALWLPTCPSNCVQYYPQKKINNWVSVKSSVKWIR